MKRLHGELDYLMMRQAETVKVISHVKANGYHSAVVFLKYTATEEFATEANAEFARYGESTTAGEHYYIMIIATYGKEYNENKNTKHKDTFEVSKEEGNRIYMEVIKAKAITY